MPAPRPDNNTTARGRQHARGRCAHTAGVCARTAWRSCPARPQTGTMRRCARLPNAARAAQVRRVAPSERTKGGHGTPSRARRRNSLDRHGNPTASARPPVTKRRLNLIPLKAPARPSRAGPASHSVPPPPRCVCVCVRRPQCPQPEPAHALLRRRRSLVRERVAKQALESSSLQRRAQCSQAARAAA